MRSFSKKLSLLAFIVGLCGCAHAAGTAIPSSIDNSSAAQNAEFNVGTGTVRGTMKVGTLKFGDNTTMTTASAGGGSGPFTNATSSTTLIMPKGAVVSTMTVTSTFTAQGVIIAGSGANQITTVAGLLDATKITGTLSGNNVGGGTFGAVNGSALTALNASALASGTVPNAQIDGSSVTKLGPSIDLSGAEATGILADARFPATLPAANGSQLTALNASQLTIGTVPNARLDPSSVTLLGSQIDLSGAEATGTLADARFPATLPTANGSNLTNLNASALGTGTVPNALIDSSSVTKLGSQIDLGSAESTGTLAAARFPAMTGDVTSVAGSLATTVANVPSAAIATSSITKQGNTFNGVSQLVQTTGAGALPAISGVNLTNIPGANITGTVPNAALDSATVTKQGNSFNGASQLVALDSSSRLPAVNASLVTGVSSVTASVFQAGISAGANVTITNTGAGVQIAATGGGGSSPFTNATSSTSLNNGGFAYLGISTNSWINATINGATTYWTAPPISSTAPYFPYFNGSQVNYATVITGVVTNTSSNTKSGYLLMTSTFGVAASASPPVSGVGQIGFDTTDNQYVGHNGTIPYVIAHATQSVTVFVSSGTGWDNLTIPFWEAPADNPVTITSIDSAVMGGTSVTFNVEKRSNASLASGGITATGSAIVAVTGTTHTSVFSSAAAAKSAWLVLTTGSSAASGSVNGLVLTINYLETVE